MAPLPLRLTTKYSSNSKIYRSPFKKNNNINCNPLKELVRITKKKKKRKPTLSRIKLTIELQIMRSILKRLKRFKQREIQEVVNLMLMPRIIMTMKKN